MYLYRINPCFHRFFLAVFMIGEVKEQRRLGKLDLLIAPSAQGADQTPVRGKTNTTRNTRPVTTAMLPAIETSSKAAS